MTVSIQGSPVANRRVFSPNRKVNVRTRTPPVTSRLTSPSPVRRSVSRDSAAAWARPAYQVALPRQDFVLLACLPNTNFGLLSDTLLLLNEGTIFRTLYGEDTEGSKCDFDGGDGGLMTQSMHSESVRPSSLLPMSASCVGWTTSQHRPNALCTSDKDGSASDSGSGIIVQDISDSERLT